MLRPAQSMITGIQSSFNPRARSYQGPVVDKSWMAYVCLGPGCCGHSEELQVTVPPPRLASLRHERVGHLGAFHHVASLHRSGLRAKPTATCNRTCKRSTSPLCIGFLWSMLPRKVNGQWFPYGFPMVNGFPMVKVSILLWFPTRMAKGKYLLIL